MGTKIELGHHYTASSFTMVSIEIALGSAAGIRCYPYLRGNSAPLFATAFG